MQVLFFKRYCFKLCVASAHTRHSKNAFHCPTFAVQCAPAQQAILHDNTSQVLRNTNVLNFISPFYSISYYPQTIVGDKKGEKIEKNKPEKKLSFLNHESSK